MFDEPNLMIAGATMDEWQSFRLAEISNIAKPTWFWTAPRPGWSRATHNENVGLRTREDLTAKEIRISRK